MSETEYDKIKHKGQKVTKEEKPKKQSSAVSDEEIKRKIEPIVSRQNVEIQKPGVARRLSRVVFGQQGFVGLMGYLGRDVMAPALKDMIYNMTVSGISSVVYKDGNYHNYNNQRPSRNPYSRQVSRSGYNDYSRASRRSNVARRGDGPVEVSQDLDFTQYIISDMQDAKAVLGSLQGDVHEYGHVSVAEAKQYLDIDSEFTDWSYGWTDLSTARVVRARGGWALDLPPYDVI